MKKYILLMMCMILLTACGSSKKNTSNNEVTDVDSFSGDYYKMLNNGRGTNSENFYLEYSGTKDLVTIGSGLQRISSKYFSTDSYYLSEGQQLSNNDYSQFLKRDSENAKKKSFPYTLQPARGTELDGIKNMVMVNSLIEQDYYKKTATSYVIKGASIAVILNPTDEKGNRISTELKTSTLKTYCDGALKILYKYIRDKKKALKDIPIVVAFYMMNDNNVSLINGNYKYQAYCEDGKAGSLKSVNFENVVFSSTRASKLDPITSSEFDTIKSALKKASTEAAGLVGEAQYVDNTIQSMKITAHLNIKTYTEMLYLTSILADRIDSKFTQDFQIKCLVYSQDSLMAVIIKNKGESVKTTIIEQ